MQGVLTKLSTAKELIKEIMERERKKQSERDAEKAKKQEGKIDGCVLPVPTSDLELVEKN